MEIHKVAQQKVTGEWGEVHGQNQNASLNRAWSELGTEPLELDAQQSREGWEAREAQR